MASRSHYRGHRVCGRSSRPLEVFEPTDPLALDSPGTLQCFFRSPIVASMLHRKRHVPQGCRAVGEVGPMHPLEDLECLLEVRNGLLVKPARVANESQPVQGYPCTAPRRVLLVEDSQRLQEQWFGFIMPA